MHLSYVYTTPQGPGNARSLTQTFDPRVGILTVLSNPGWGQFDKLVFSSRVLCSLQKNFLTFSAVFEKWRNFLAKMFMNFGRVCQYILKYVLEFFIFFKLFFITYLNLEIRIKFWPLFFIFFPYAIFVNCILLKLNK